MNTKELVRIALQMEKCIDNRSYGDVLTLLSDLGKVRITSEQLETTDIVKVLYRLLKSCPDNNLKKTVKSLLAKWKKQYGKDRDMKCTEKEKVSEQSCGDSSLNICDKGVSEPENIVSGDEDSHQTLPLTSESTSLSCLPSSVRSKGVQFLLAALSKGVTDQETAADLAGKLEEHIHELHKSNNTRYRACIRSKVANLRNPKNGHLLTGLLNGSLTPGVFAGMSAAEMAGEELRQLREEYSSQGVSERQLPQGIEGTKTQIRCKRCGGSDCRVTQVSRGALFLPAWVRRGGPDEDAMTFVTCSGCGQQWYHSGWICL
ncbi:transcription elongation factor A N-terminal and central domain-containing protein [Xyrichtys novacula]|uniref:Transcription elongation factor A N-terminal and central domain-containing protein n=1 Tax=Xyrichtys novacula TaxID=13765 RepID=A0AAV1HNX6_XYRNO|nr:transcription elongation factor A N-terminal and central domain-containing protein [Xyrichtys novacula]